VIHRSSGREEVANVGFGGKLNAVRLILRVAIGSLIAVVLAIAIVPLLVLRDLNSGGTGWGLCSEGIGGCSTSYFAGFELIAVLLLALFGALALLRVATRALRFVEHRYDLRRSASERLEFPSPGPAPQSGWFLGRSRSR